MPEDKKDTKKEEEKQKEKKEGKENIGQSKPRAASKYSPDKHNVEYLFRKEKVKPYLLQAFLLFTKWQPKNQVTREEFKKKLKGFLKR